MPRRRRGEITNLVTPLDRAIRNTRVLVRRCAVSVWRTGELPAEFPMMRSRSHRKVRIPVIPARWLRLTGMTIHRLMAVIAGEQEQFTVHGETVPTFETTDGRNDATAEQHRS